jgi:hypothetical protein
MLLIMMEVDKEYLMEIVDLMVELMIGVLSLYRDFHVVGVIIDLFEEFLLNFFIYMNE